MGANGDILSPEPPFQGCGVVKMPAVEADFYLRIGLMVGVALSSLAMHVWALIRSKPQNWIVSLLCFLFVLFMTLQCDMGRYCDHFHKG